VASSTSTRNNAANKWRALPPHAAAASLPPSTHTGPRPGPAPGPPRRRLKAIPAPAPSARRRAADPGQRIGPDDLGQQPGHALRQRAADVAGPQPLAVVLMPRQPARPAPPAPRQPDGPSPASPRPSGKSRPRPALPDRSARNQWPSGRYRSRCGTRGLPAPPQRPIKAASIPAIVFGHP
jgi:hypothetical protein